MSMDGNLGRAVLRLETDDSEWGPGLNKAKGQVSGLESALGSVKGMLGGIGTAMVGAFAVAKVIEAGKAALDYAGHISDIAAKMKISTTTAQEWEGVFGKAGVSLDQVAKAATELSTKVIGGDKSAVAALTKLGFSVEQLKAMRAEERFNVVADAIGKIQDSGEQLYASKAILGKNGPELLAALDGNLQGTIDQMHSLGMVIDEETIAAADEFGDQLGMMSKQLMGILATIIGPLLPALSTLGNVLMWLGANVIGPVLNATIKAAMYALYQLVESAAAAISTVAKFGAAIPGIGKYIQQYADLQERVSAKAADLKAKLYQQADATEKTGQAAETVAPKLIGFGQAAESAGQSASRNAPRVREVKKAVEEVQTTVSATGRPFGTFVLSLDQMKRLSQGLTHDGLIPLSKGFDVAAARADALRDRQEALARTSQHLADMIARQSVGLIQGGTGLNRMALEADGLGASADGAGGRLGQLGSKVSGFFQNIPATMGQAQSAIAGKLTTLFGASTDSVLGSVISGGLNFVFGPLSGLATQLITQGMEALGKVVWSGLQKIGGFFKNLFGGPSAEELAGRQVVQQFEDNLASMLTESQKLEAGNDRWKMTVIAIRDQYVEMGLSEEQALKDAERLWKASKDGGEDVQAVIDEINRKFGRGITVPVRFDMETPPTLPTTPGGELGRGGASPSLGLVARSTSAFFGDSASSRPFIINLNGHEIARGTLPYLFDAAQAYGLVR